MRQNKDFRLPEGVQLRTMEGINKISLVAFKDNALGNAFWHEEGGKMRQDLNVYDFILNEENITRFNK